ncbi:hypothetical protein [Aquincola sp. J276]|uniref:hypothetical protein n=1 Tax=Aquincola sp. J276 TaxID=2898432 RepID=UPI002151C2E4|nr:hypothetical protein [Aquincola sp. J276]MCR5864456.1 hypothetical protein [Aquincola sp. J276]
MAAGADDGIAGAAQQRGIGGHRAGTGAQLAGEAVVQAGKALLLGIAQVEVGEQPPHRDRQPRQQRAAQLAEAAHPARERDARDAVGEQEVQVFLLQQAAPGAGFHGAVNHLG